MRSVLAIWRLGRVAIHLAHGMVLMAVRFNRLPLAKRHELIQWWSAKLLRLLGVEVRCQGGLNQASSLVVANHVSWMDIAAIHAVAPRVRFVSKSDVLRWPLLGRLISGSGTLFIERERKRDAMRVVHEMAAALAAGDTVAVFPEGTTGPGPQVLPFHANLLQAAISVASPIQPLALHYADRETTFSTAAQYIGDTSLARSLWWVASASGLAVHLNFLPAQPSANGERRALSQMLKTAIQEALPVPAQLH